MKLTLDALLVLDAIDHKGSFAAAAKELYRVPSAITYTIRKLEQDLDAPLFDRSGHKAELTPAGDKLLEDGRSLLRAASELEAAVKRTATGWESELRIALSDILPQCDLLCLVNEFYQENCGTQIKISREVLQGAWDTLTSGRADLTIGAPGMIPSGGGYHYEKMGSIRFLFVTTPDHPLTKLKKPLTEADILIHRAVAAADSSRNLPVLTTALLTGQQVLTVPDLETKCQAHRDGLGVGYVPEYMVHEDIISGNLTSLGVASPLPLAEIYMAWPTGEKGKALDWFIQRLREHSLWRNVFEKQ
ncbi:LysR substrate-binding domain-containing protein [Candidatus Vondammii sp. HM_W22]|uniref:LysR substrate-binding domain-containing protein n=1 Tax=Candidatus Vondammii sp. HM_W22 TaxID=2687299 RepID=UPI002A4E2492|nr:LysR substrate-binding domain-containing protein [Candidatus Vondammii sp. HM_W22]